MLYLRQFLCGNIGSILAPIISGSTEGSTSTSCLLPSSSQNNHWLVENGLLSRAWCETVHPRFGLEGSVTVPREALGHCARVKDWDNAVSVDEPHSESGRTILVAKSIRELIKKKERLRKEANDQNKGI